MVADQKDKDGTSADTHQDIFKDVTYYIVGDVSPEVIKLLDSHGAKRDSYLSDIVSHVIADSTQPDEYSEAKELFDLPVVSSQWVTLSVKCGKQLPKDVFALEGRLFSGLRVCPHQLDPEDAKSVWGMVTYHGGQCVLRLDRTVTHLVTTETSGEKYEVALQHSDLIKIVTPDWFVDSIRNGELMDEKIYHPKLVFTPKQEILDPEMASFSADPFTFPGGRQVEPMNMSPPSAVGTFSSSLGHETVRIKMSPSDEMFRTNGSSFDISCAKEALARMVTHRLYKSEMPDLPTPRSGISPVMPHNLQTMPGGPFPPMTAASHPGMPPSMSMSGSGPGHANLGPSIPAQVLGHAGTDMPHRGISPLPGMSMGRISQFEMPGHLVQGHAHDGSGVIPGPGGARSGSASFGGPGGGGHLPTGGSGGAAMHTAPPPQQMSQGQFLHGYSQHQPHPSPHHMQQQRQPQQQPLSQQHLQHMPPAPHQQQLQHHQQFQQQQLQHQQHMQHHQQQTQQHQMPHQQHIQHQQQMHQQQQQLHHQQQQQMQHQLLQQQQQLLQQQQQQMHQHQLHQQQQLHLQQQQQMHQQQQQMQQQLQPMQHQQQQVQQQSPQPVPQPLQQQQQQHQQQHQLQQQQPVPQQPPPQVHPAPVQKKKRKQQQQQQLPSPSLPPQAAQQVQQAGPSRSAAGSGRDDSPTSRTTLKNITNSGSPPANVRQSAAKINQMFGNQQRPPPAYPYPPQTPGPPAPPPAPTPQFEYFGHEMPDAIPLELCLLGCVFYIGDYQTTYGSEETATWTQIIEQYGGKVSPVYCSDVTHFLCSDQKLDALKLKALDDEKRMVTAFWLNDVLMQKKMQPPWQALHIPLIYTGDSRPCKNQIISITNFNGEERKRVKRMIQAIGAKYTGYMTRANSVLVCKRPGGMKFEKAKEWRVPVVNVQWLSDLVLGQMDALRLPVQMRYLQVGHARDFYADLGRVWQWMMGWRRPIRVSKELLQKAVQMPRKAIRTEADLAASGTEPPAKRPRLEEDSPLPEDNTIPRILFTGYPATIIKRLTAIAEKLGGKVTENPQHCTHLVSQKLTRTIKFFHAINVCNYIITKEWLEESSLQGRFLEEEKYFLRDEVGEREVGCRLQESLRRAKASPIFRGLVFYITPGVVPPVEELKRVIESAGGAVLKRRPSSKSTSKMKDDKGKSTFIVITCPNDVHLCRDLMAQKIDVYSAEMALTGVLRQELDWKMYRLDYSLYPI